MRKFILYTAICLTFPLFSPSLQVKAQSPTNLWWIPNQFLPNSATDICTLTGAVNCTSGKTLHVCQFSITVPSGGSSATFSAQDVQSTPQVIFDAVGLNSASASSWTKIIEGKYPESCVPFTGGVKVFASSASAIKFSMKGYY